jgi:hypothetical protein
MRKLLFIRVFLFVLVTLFTLLNVMLIVDKATAGQWDCETTYSADCYQPIWHICSTICTGFDEECDFIIDEYNTCNYGACDTWWYWECTDGYYEYDEWCWDPGLYCPLK